MVTDGHLRFLISTISYFSIYRSSCSFSTFQPKLPNGLQEVKKNAFQDGVYGGHFGFPIDMILVIFHLNINLLLHHKYQLNSPCALRDNFFLQDGCGGFRISFWAKTNTKGLEKLSKNDFQDGGCG